MADDPSRLRKALSSAVKRKVKEEDDYEKLTRLIRLRSKVCLVSADEDAKVCGKTIQTPHQSRCGLSSMLQ